MSFLKNKATKFHTTNQDVKFKLSWMRIDGLDAMPNVSIKGGFTGRVGATEGEVEFKAASISLQDIKDNCTAQEKQTLRAAIALFERELGRADAEFDGVTQDDTDVFVEPAE